MTSALTIYSNLANTILKQETRYQSNKKIIQAVFKTSIDNFRDTIQFRLTVIDSYYSTQMSKRLYGIEDITNELIEYSDEDLKLEITRFLENPKDGIIADILSKPYGFDKGGKKPKKAVSLLSKYLYFLSNCQFPIYDSLAEVSYKLLQKNNYIPVKSLNQYNYFDLMIKLNKSSGINDFEKLDNLLWLLGKITEGSFSILMDKSKYEAIVGQLKFNKETSQQKDNAIREYIKKAYEKSDSFSEIEKKFLRFAFNLS